MTTKVSPTSIIREEMDCRGWNVAKLATEAGWQPKLAQEIVQGRAITRLVAIGLAQAFGTSEDLWLRLQASYEASTTGNAHMVSGTRTRGRPKATASVPPPSGSDVPYVFSPPSVEPVESVNGETASV